MKTFAAEKISWIHDGWLSQVPFSAACKRFGSLGERGLKSPFNLHCTPLYDNLKAGKNLWLLSTGTGLAPFLSRVLAFICIALLPVHVIRNANSMWSSAG
ncbi:hypothetical protein FHV99_004561 [Ochrobactrum sp. P20RRXII]|nr:hypothetical protein [Ochrobactrum sp. P20RRXII]